MSEVYKTKKIILQNPDKYKVLLERAFNELKYFKRRYEDVAELKEVIEAIDNVLE